MCVCVSLCVPPWVGDSRVGGLLVLSLKPLWTEHGGHQGPHVEQEADPAGGHLNPEDRPAPVQQLLNLGVVVTVGTRAKQTSQDFTQLLTKQTDKQTIQHNVYWQSVLVLCCVMSVHHSSAAAMRQAHIA